jgi:serine/threonine protein kinase
MIAKQVLERLRDLHKLGYIHNDIKMENIVIGSSDPNMIYLLDFGACERFQCDEDHIEQGEKRRFTGNAMFGSVNSCKRKKCSRRDDLESLLFLVIYFVNDSTLPWSKDDNMNGTLQGFLNQKTSPEILEKFNSPEYMPSELRKVKERIDKLEFEEEPDYQWFIQQFLTLSKHYKALSS